MSFLKTHPSSIVTTGPNGAILATSVSATRIDPDTKLVASIASLSPGGGTGTAPAAATSGAPIGVIPAAEFSKLLITHSFTSRDVLDLRSQGLTTLNVLHSKFQSQSLAGPSSSSSSASSASSTSDGRKYPWTILILSSNLLTRIDTLYRCVHLRKLDLSHNQITRLPNKTFWKCVPKLQVLLLDNNRIEQIHNLYDLSALPELTVLTLYGNAVEHHHAYRHVLVNRCESLKLLDFYCISDEELIEGAKWGSRFGTWSLNLECVLGDHTTPIMTPREEMTRLNDQLRLVRTKHAKWSPIITIQRVWRGASTRMKLRQQSKAAVRIQTHYRRFFARQIVRRRLKAEAASGGAVADSMRRTAARSAGANTLYFVATSEVAQSVFMQLVKRVETEQKIRAPHLMPGHMLLLSTPNLKDQTPLARRVARFKKHVFRLLPGRDFKRHESLERIRHRASGVGLALPADFHTTLALRLKVDTRQQQLPVALPPPVTPINGAIPAVARAIAVPPRRRKYSILRFECPTAAFHDALASLIQQYNTLHGYDTIPDFHAGLDAPPLPPLPSELSSRVNSRAGSRAEVKSESAAAAAVAPPTESQLRRAADARQNMLLIYPGTPMTWIAACVTIQCAWRAARVRRAHMRVPPNPLPYSAASEQPNQSAAAAAHRLTCMGDRIVVRRAIVVLIRWWRTQLFRIRCRLLSGLRAYGESIQTSTLFMRGDGYDVLDDAPNVFVSRTLFPEHRTLFDMLNEHQHIAALTPRSAAAASGIGVGAMSPTAAPTTGGTASAFDFKLATPLLANAPGPSLAPPAFNLASNAALSINTNAGGRFAAASAAAAADPNVNGGNTPRRRSLVLSLAPATSAAKLPSSLAVSPLSAAITSAAMTGAGSGESTASFSGQRRGSISKAGAAPLSPRLAAQQLQVPGMGTTPSNGGSGGSIANSPSGGTANRGWRDRHAPAGTAVAGSWRTLRDERHAHEHRRRAVWDEKMAEWRKREDEKQKLVSYFDAISALRPYPIPIWMQRLWHNTLIPLIQSTSGTGADNSGGSGSGNNLSPLRMEPVSKRLLSLVHSGASISKIRDLNVLWTARVPTVAQAAPAITPTLPLPHASITHGGTVDILAAGENAENINSYFLKLVFHSPSIAAHTSPPPAPPANTGLVVPHSSRHRAASPHPPPAVTVAALAAANALPPPLTPAQRASNTAAAIMARTNSSLAVTAATATATAAASAAAAAAALALDIVQARLIALTLAIWTYDPRRPWSMLTLMTHEHIRACTNAKALTSEDERKTMYDLYWGRTAQERNRTSGRYVSVPDYYERRSRTPAPSAAPAGKKSTASAAATAAAASYVPKAGRKVRLPAEWVDIKQFVPPQRSPTLSAFAATTILSSPSATSTSTAAPPIPGISIPLGTATTNVDGRDEFKSEFYSADDGRPASANVSRPATSNTAAAPQRTATGSQTARTAPSISAEPVAGSGTLTLRARRAPTAAAPSASDLARGAAPALTATKQEWASTQRADRTFIETELRIQTLTALESARKKIEDATTHHRVKMDHIVAREQSERAVRAQLQHDWSVELELHKANQLAANVTAVHTAKQAALQATEMRALEQKVSTRATNRRIRTEKALVTASLLKRWDDTRQKVLYRKVEMKRSAAKHARLAADRAATVAFVVQQNAISRQLSDGVGWRQRAARQAAVQATVNEQRTAAAERRHAVRQVLFENFGRRKQAALATALETRANLAMRAVAEATKIEVYRSHRDHVATVKASAIAAVQNLIQTQNTASTTATATASASSLVPRPPATSRGGTAVDQKHASVLTQLPAGVSFPPVAANGPTATGSFSARSTPAAAATATAAAASQLSDDAHMRSQLEKLQSLAGRVKDQYESLSKHEKRINAHLNAVSASTGRKTAAAATPTAPGLSPYPLAPNPNAARR